MFFRHVPLWGFPTNRNFNGIVGLFQRDQIEVSVTPLWLTIERSEFCDFSVITWLTTPTIVFRHPRTGIRNIFAQPFSPMVWIVLLLVLLLVSACVTVSMKFQKTHNVSIARAFVFTLGILCQQGFIERFGKLSVRLFMFTAILFSLIMYQFYSSFIVGSLLTESPKTINTLRELIDSKMEVGIEEISYNHVFFNVTTDETALELFHKRIEKQGNFFDVTTGIQNMKRGGFAFHVDTSYAYQTIEEMLNEEEVCDLNEILLFPNRQLSTAVDKGSPLKEFITIALLRVLERGLHAHHLKRWRAKKPKCVRSITKIKAIEIGEASVIFILLAVAMMISFVILIGEIIHFRLRKIE